MWNNVPLGNRKAFANTVGNRFGTTLPEELDQSGYRTSKNCFYIVIPTPVALRDKRSEVLRTVEKH